MEQKKHHGRSPQPSPASHRAERKAGTQTKDRSEARTRRSTPERAGASACLSGRHALRNISKLYFQKCFISVAAADLNAGYMVDTEDEAELYQILMQHSEQTTLLLDYSKVGQRALVPLCPLHEIRTVISNIQMPEAYKSYYFDHGVTVFTTIKDL